MESAYFWEAYGRYGTGDIPSSQELYEVFSRAYEQCYSTSGGSNFDYPPAPLPTKSR